MSSVWHSCNVKKQICVTGPQCVNKDNFSRKIQAIGINGGSTGFSWLYLASGDLGYEGHDGIERGIFLVQLRNHHLQKKSFVN